jgi:hypothetical protein
MIYKHALNVVNEAISMIGSNRLMTTVDTDAEDPTLRNLALLYNSARVIVLLEHPWNFARAIEPAAATLQGQVYLCSLPGDCLRLMSVYNAEGQAIAHDRIGSLIRCTEAPSEIWYLRDDDNPDLWDPWVRRALVHRLAADFARPLTGSMIERDLQETAYNNALVKAKTVNAQEDQRVMKPTFAHDVINGIK